MLILMVCSTCKCGLICRTAVIYCCQQFISLQVFEQGKFLVVKWTSDNSAHFQTACLQVLTSDTVVFKPLPFVYILMHLYILRNGIAWEMDSNVPSHVLSRLYPEHSLQCVVMSQRSG